MSYLATFEDKTNFISALRPALQLPCLITHLYLDHENSNLHLSVLTYSPNQIEILLLTYFN